ncbi:MAG: hypothetical protein M5U26_04455 [Planctomycetota bacterium]|nr:hypothetical protein [Planctomycetota bacterium]
MAVQALEALDGEGRERALTAMQEAVAEQLVQDSSDGRAWRLGYGDLLLACGRTDPAMATYRELRTHPDAEPDLRARALLRLGALEVLNRQTGNPIDLGMTLENNAEFPEEANVAGHFLVSNYTVPQLDDEIRRVGGPAVFSASEWEMVKILKLVGEAPPERVAEAVQALGKECKAKRSWPFLLARLQAPGGGGSDQ